MVCTEVCKPPVRYVSAVVYGHKFTTQLIDTSGRIVFGHEATLEVVPRQCNVPLRSFLCQTLCLCRVAEQGSDGNTPFGMGNSTSTELIINNTNPGVYVFRMSSLKDRKLNMQGGEPSSGRSSWCFDSEVCASHCHLYCGLQLSCQNLGCSSSDMSG